MHRSIALIRSFGKKAGVSIVPTTHEDVLDYILSEVDLVLVMTVNPGFGGQKFIDLQLRKIANLRKKIDLIAKEQNKIIELEVDGGINNNNAKLVIEAGADVLVAGSYIFNSKNYHQAISSLRS